MKKKEIELLRKQMQKTKDGIETVIKVLDETNFDGHVSLWLIASEMERIGWNDVETVKDLEEFLNIHIKNFKKIYKDLYDDNNKTEDGKVMIDVEKYDSSDFGFILDFMLAFKKIFLDKK